MNAHFKLGLCIWGSMWAATIANAADWVSRHGMTTGEFQSEFDTWTEAPYHYRLLSLAGYSQGNQARYAAIWADEPGPAWAARGGATGEELNALSADYAAQGYYPVLLNGFGLGNTAYYNAIWEYDPDAEVVSLAGLSYQAYQAEHQDRVADGYDLVQLWTYNVGATEYFAAIWRRGEVAEYTVRTRRTAGEYQQDFSDLAAVGYQLVAVSAAVVNGESLFSGVWKTPGDGVAWYGHHDLSEMNYQAQTWNWEYQGYRPVFVSAFQPNAGDRFNMIVQRNDGLTPDNLAQVNEAISDYMNDNDIPGLSLAISRDGELVYAKGFGEADQDADEWTHPFHRFRIASVSKPVTAVAALKLRDCCGVDLDDTVFGDDSILGSAYGTPSELEEDITVRHLLEHTTGWDDGGDGEDDGVWNVGGTDPGPAIAWQIANTDPIDDPGDTFNYMNTDYATLGRIIETVSGRSYEQFVQEEVLAPACITSMEIGGESLGERKPNEVVYYQSYQGNPYNLSPSRMDAHGGWIATPTDLLLLMRRIDGDPAHAEILTADSVFEMQSGSSASDGSYGLGLFLGSDGFGHNGCMWGTIAFLERRNDGMAFAVVCNSRPEDDSCAGGLKAVVNDLIDNLNASGGWPAYDLFPCAIGPGDPPASMEVTKDIYVDGACNSWLPDGQQDCGFAHGPYPTVNQGVEAVCAGDRLFIRAGSYHESVVFDRRVTVRSYDGAAAIGE